MDPANKLQLTKDAIHTMIDLQQLSLNDKTHRFTLQLLNVKELQSSKPSQQANDSKRKYRLMLSDGKSKIAAITYKSFIDPIVNQYITLQVEIIKEHSIIELKSFKVMTLDGREIIMINSCPRVISCTMDNMIGNPQHYRRVGGQQELTLSRDSPIRFAETEETKDQTADTQRTPEKAEKYMAIKELTTYASEDWKIKARITKKGKKVSYQNGFLFKIELIDEEGTQIEGTFYKDSFEQFFHRVEEDRLYLFSKGQIATANKKFCSIQNEYRIIFNEQSVISEYITERESVIEKFQKNKFNFVPIKEIFSIQELKQLDVCGVVVSSVQWDNVDIKMDYGKDAIKGKLVFTIMDNTSSLINVYFWGELSQTEVKEGDVVVINGARVSHFGGKSLNCHLEHCKVLINPEPDTVTDLDKYLDLGKTKPAHQVDTIQEQIQCQQQEYISSLKENQILIAKLLKDLSCGYDGVQTEGEHLKFKHNPQNIYCLQGSFTRFVTPMDQVAYLGCSQCFRKVTDNRLTGFYCNSCKQIVKEKHLYFIHAIFQDFTGKILMGFSREQAQELMNGVEAQVFMTQIRKGFKSEVEFEEWLKENVFFRTFRILVKAKQEQFNKQQRLRFYALDVALVKDRESQESNESFKQENRMLLKELEKEAE